MKQTLFIISGILGASFVNAVCMFLSYDYAVPVLILVDSVNVYVTLFFVLGLFFMPYHPRHYGLNLNKPRETLGIGLGAGIPSVFIVILIRWYLYNEGMTDFGFNPGLKFSYVIYPVFVLAQEVVVKGYLQSYFVVLLGKYKFGKPVAILISAVIFAQFHLLLGIPIFLFTFGYGVFTGWLYERSRSVTGIALLHFFAGFTLLNFSNFYS